MESTTISWQGGMSFDVGIEDHHFSIDAAEQFGGQGRGPKPKTLILSALAGCTGMDVVSILGKMRMPFESLNIKVDGKLTEKHPKVFESIHLTYTVTGAEVDPKKVEKAVRLSQDVYCGVTAMLEKAVGEHNITYEILLPGGVRIESQSPDAAVA